jgi:hypothetical protein
MTTVELLAQYGIDSPKAMAALKVCTRQYASHIFRGRRGIGKDLAFKLLQVKQIPLEASLRATKPKGTPKLKPGPKPRNHPRKPKAES